MASLQQESTGKFHIVIFHAGKRHKRSLGTKKLSHALARKDEIEEVLDLVKRGQMTVPDGVSLIDFALSDGKIDEVPEQMQMQTEKSARRIEPGPSRDDGTAVRQSLWMMQLFAAS